MLEYEVWANERSLASLGTVPPERRASTAFVRATQLLPHCALSRTVWLLRIRGQEAPPPQDWFPSWELEETRRQLRTLDTQWRHYFAGMRYGEPARIVTYTSSEGVRYTSSVEEVCQHVALHSSYHRGQVARLVHECGGQRASTDFIVFARQHAPQ